MMTTIPGSVSELLATGILAHLATLDPDGTPHVTLSWAGFDGDELVFSAFFPEQQKVWLRRDPRVTLSFQSKEYAGPGLHPYVVIAGRAREEQGGALALMDRLAEHYLGSGQRYPMRDLPEGAVFRVAIDRIYGQGPWREGWTG
jgi:PPOX class probable F420-dependent enzyme